jgi:hypothetical protein
VAEGTVYHACLDIGISRKTHYDWLKDDAVYAQAFVEAKEIRCDLLEHEADRRAIKGWDEPVFYQGRACGVIRKYSDQMLDRRLKAELPQKYRERWEGSLTVPMPVTVIIQKEEAEEQAPARK